MTHLIVAVVLVGVNKKMRNNILKLNSIFKIVYLAFCCLFVIEFFNHPEHWINSEVTLIFTLKMLFIAFPSSIIGWITIWLIGLVFNQFTYWQYIDFYLFLSLISVLGYWQWFVLTPRLWEKFKNRGKNTDSANIE